jgi:hypothetical protein
MLRGGFHACESENSIRIPEEDGIFGLRVLENFLVSSHKIRYRLGTNVTFLPTPKNRVIKK